MTWTYAHTEAAIAIGACTIVGAILGALTSLILDR